MPASPLPDNRDLRGLAREWDALVEEVRCRPGLTDFFVRPSIDRLQQAALGGPVIIVNCSDWRSDAVILTGDAEPVVPLPEVTPDSVRTWSSSMLAALRRYDLAVAAVGWAGEGLSDDRRQSRARLTATRDAIQARVIATERLAALQHWMWRAIAEPVLDRLGYHATPEPGNEWPHVWWCLTGPLAFLPIHAAEEGTLGHGVMDRVISSYTPTVAALLDSRRPPITSDQSQFLVIGLDESITSPLAGAADERQVIETHLGPSAVHYIDASAASGDSIREALSRHSWVHFACHAQQDIASPFTGGFLVGDGTLSLAQIAADRFSGEFAALAACETAKGGWALADESISLTVAIHRTGYRHVVGTLWSIDDAVSARMFAELYKIMLAGGTLDATGAGAALHRVLRDMRNGHREDPLRWAPFMHVGPT